MRIQASVLTQEFYPICTQEKSPTEANAAFQLGSMFHIKETKQLYFITIKISVSISQNAKAVICLLSEGSSLLRRCLRPEKQLAAHPLPKVSWASLGKRTKPGVVLWEPDSSCDGSVGPNLSAFPPSLPRAQGKAGAESPPYSFCDGHQPPRCCLAALLPSQSFRLVWTIAFILLYFPLSLANKILFFSSDYLYYLSRSCPVLILTSKCACSLSLFISYKCNPC